MRFSLSFGTSLTLQNSSHTEDDYSVHKREGSIQAVRYYCIESENCIEFALKFPLAALHSLVNWLRFSPFSCNQSRHP